MSPGTPTSHLHAARPGSVSPSLDWPGRDGGALPVGSKAGGGRHRAGYGGAARLDGIRVPDELATIGVREGRHSVFVVPLLTTVSGPSGLGCATSRPDPRRRCRGGRSFGALKRRLGVIIRGSACRAASPQPARAAGWHAWAGSPAASSISYPEWWRYGRPAPLLGGLIPAPCVKAGQ